MNLYCGACREFERGLPSDLEAREGIAMQKACAWYHVTYAQPWSHYSAAHSSQVTPRIPTLKLQCLLA